LTVEVRTGPVTVVEIGVSAAAVPATAMKQVEASKYVRINVPKV
jgi:hypothetical protein